MVTSIVSLVWEISSSKFIIALKSGVEAEAESLIINHSNTTYKNHESLYLGSGIMGNETLRKAQQNTRMN